MKVKREKDYYDINMNIFKTKEFELKGGISVLVGCNGYEKSTTLKNIQKVGSSLLLMLLTQVCLLMNLLQLMKSFVK